MASKGRVPPPHHRRPLPSPGVVHPDSYASAMRPPHGAFPPFEMLPPHEVMAHKLSAQHVEIEKLATENQRLAATHGTLRQDLAASKHDLQIVHAHIANVKSEKEQQMRGIIDKMSKMESELEGAESIKMELQQARGEAQTLVTARQELVSKVQQLTRDLQMAHSEVQQIPPLMAELDTLRQEYHHSRATYDYEKKLYNDHLESLQVMEKNYMAMSREVEKLRAELSNATNLDPRTVQGQYGGYGGYNESAFVGNYASAQAYGGGQQGQAPHLGGGSSPHIAAQPAPYGSGTAPDAPRGPAYPAFRGTSYDPIRAHVGAGYEAQRVQAGVSYETQRAPTGPGYEAQRGPTPPAHNTPRGIGYEAQRGLRSEAQKGPGPGYDARKGPAYDGQNAPVHDMQRGSGDEVKREKGTVYDASSRGIGAQGQVALNNVPHQSTPNTRAGMGYESVARGTNPRS